MANVKKSITPGGIFCGQLFGINDEWSNRPSMTFHTREQAEELFTDMEIVSFEEEESDSITVNATPKHWHIFHVIARKKY